MELLNEGAAGRAEEFRISLAAPAAHSSEDVQRRDAGSQLSADATPPKRR